ncbi:hypothetical protein [Guptibacillus hwajinpoensis]|uniref:hypothetical protein n=1 Tax=Guptibacillus hwajinpoensis TaxID=208199 RepID=UPI001CFEFB44|nr:hypothetical protein [Pseudalkalibacillus hwajinpoensis]WLR59058.1 hypothetical protein LC071_18190 [Pseudalkalibacillus hwajinpoensis]
MKRFITLLGVFLLLAACANEGSNEGKQEEKGSTQKTSASSLHIKPAKLSKREQSIVNQMGIDFKTFYTVDGTVGEGEALVTSIVVYNDGEDGKEEFVTWGGNYEQERFNKALHSFQLQMEEKVAYFTMGSPDGYSKGSTNMPKELGAFIFEQIEEEVTITKGETVYLAYLIGSSENQMPSVNDSDVKTLPESVKTAEYAIVAQLEWKDNLDKKE